MRTIAVVRRAKGWLLLLLVLTLVLGVVAALVLTGGSRRPSSPADEVRDLVTAQIDMWDRSDFAGLYQTLSPAVRKVCGYSAAVTTATAARAYWGEITLENLSVHVAGTTASVTGVLLIPGQPARLISANDPVSEVVRTASLGAGRLPSCSRTRIVIFDLSAAMVQLIAAGAALGATVAAAAGT